MEFLEKLIECFQSKIESGHWISLLFWSFIAARVVTFAEQIIRKAMTNSLELDFHGSWVNKDPALALSPDRMCRPVMN